MKDIIIKMGRPGVATSATPRTIFIQNAIKESARREPIAFEVHAGVSDVAIPIKEKCSFYSNKRAYIYIEQESKEAT